jgi:four helix bundle protein
MKTNNVIQDKSYAFALRIIELHTQLIEARNFELGSQVLKSGTSIGANVEEAIGAISTKDFLAKLTISYKEARETRYWLRLLRDSHKILPENANSLINEVEELLRIITAIQKTTRTKISFLFFLIANLQIR